jgi:sugar phosphate isomerase/epimerase
MLFGFDIEGAKFSMEYVKAKFEYLHKKVELLEVPVYVFIRRTQINEKLLKEFLDIPACYDFKFTAHADNGLEIVTPYELSEYEIKKLQANIDVAEKINALKIVFHQWLPEGKLANVKSSIPICLENISSMHPRVVEKLARDNEVGFTLDIPHMFLYFVNNKLDIRKCYEDIAKLEPDHLHISNTYFKQSSFVDSMIYLLKGDFASAFVRLVGDFHLPLPIGHINYKKVFRHLKLPETVIMEICTTNYELLIRSFRKGKVEKGYDEDIRYFKKLLKISSKRNV